MIKIRIYALVNRPRRAVWAIVNSETNQLLCTETSMTEAIRRVEEEGWVLTPDFAVNPDTNIPWR